MTGWKQYIPAAFLLIAAGGLLSAQAQGAPASEPPPILLELFTSEGCSSCPPADALLRKLDGTLSGSGQRLIALSEHVTYWNRLGWSDPYSATLFTDRQNGYGERFGLSDVYTPQLVINGTTQLVGSNAPQIERALASQRLAPSAIVLHITSTRIAEGHLTVTYDASSPAAGTNANLLVALADDWDETKVLRGENGGRTLVHVAVARSLMQGGRLKLGTAQQVTVPLPQKTSPGDTKQHIVLFAQSPAYGPVLGVDSQPLARP